MTSFVDNLRSTTLGSRILVPTLLLSLLLVGGMGTFLVFDYSQQAEAQLRAEGESLSRLLSRISVEYLLNYDYDPLQLIIDETVANNALVVAIQIEDEEGTRLAETGDLARESQETITFGSGIRGSGGEEYGELTLVMSLDALVSSQRRGLLTVGGSALVTLVLISLGVMLVVRSVTRPLVDLVTVIERVAGGDLSTQAEIQGALELRRISESMQRMIRALSSLIGQFRDASRNVAATAEEIAATSMSMEQGARDQSSSTDQTSSSVVEIAAQIEVLSKNAYNLSSTANQAISAIHQMNSNLSRTAENGKAMLASVDETAIKVAQMSERFTGIASRLREVDDVSKETVEGARDRGLRLQRSVQLIGERIQDIDGIVKVIDGIADQTNLLALNAAIEAARAGEAGRGFTVVADEVKRLAEHVVEATGQITELVSSIRKDSREAVGQTEEVLTAILSSVETTSRLLGQTSSAADEEAKAAQGVCSTAEEMAKTSEQIVLASQENAAAADQVGQASEQISDLIEHMLRATVEQKKGLDLVVNSMDSVATIAHQNLTAVEEMAAGARQLSTESQTLLQQAEIFEV